MRLFKFFPAVMVMTMIALPMKSKKVHTLGDSTRNHRDRFLIPALASHGRCPCRFSLAFVVA